ncbi:NAD(P)/FAD-dependent oxidoreductase [Haliangium sp.]|uniref:NAD(P)/FAD-dependent oxidoreductase n=1 Tax=Haliangium sp. TaxID=2663208 RepID=UPI003D0AAF00
MRIAVVGAGVSGLVTAYLLAREHEVTVFEAGDHLGGHTHTVDVDLGAGPRPVDTGFIVFNHRTYPNFTRLLAQLGVRSQPSRMTFSVHCERTGLEWGSQALLAQPRNLLRPSFGRMLVDVLRFYRSAPKLLDQPGGELSVRDYVRRARLSTAFLDHFLVPLGASIWSCPPDQLLDFPVRFMLRFMHNHGMLQLVNLPTWRVIRGGSRSYIEPLTRGLGDRIRLRTPVAAIARHPDHVELTPADGPPERYDEVVLACHSDQALAMLADASPVERALLGAIRYQANDVVLHTDTSILPRARRAWSSWNYFIPAQRRDRAVLSYGMNILQNIDAPRFACVTVNDDGRVDPDQVLRRLRYHHPVFTLDTPRVHAQHERLIRARRTSYCGAYWGFGFHEDGVSSALAVARRFGITL